MAIAVGVAVAVLHGVVLTHYGYFRDELYYLACAQHLAFGYVDHPPFCVAVLALVRALFGPSLVAMRAVATLASVATVLLTGGLVRLLRGGIFATALACVAVAMAPVVLAFGQFYSMNSLDGLFWALAAWLLFGVLARPSVRRWLALGAVLGLGLENKASVLWLGAGMALALLVFHRELLRTLGPWLAGLLAVALALPNVLWQVAHHWPTVEFARNAMEEKYKPHTLGDFLLGVGAVANPMNLGLIFLGALAPFLAPLRAFRFLQRARPLACIVALTLVILLVSRSAKPEYLAAAFPLAFAPAAVALEHGLRRWPRARWATLVPELVLGIGAVPFVVPVLPVERFIAYQAALGRKPDSSEKKEIGPLPQLYADMFGWPELVDAVAVASRTLTAEEHAHAAVLSRTGYGPAAAVELFGPARGTPPGITGHNNFYYWGPRTFDGTALIIMGGERSWAEERFASVTDVTTYECPLCMPYEAHKTIFVARGLKQPLAQFWEERRYFE